jgi:FlaA1/EpsC-like NDP-sugar epimerase
MEMGEPVSIVELGRDLIAKSGQDIDIEFTGLRPGEKLSEQLTDDYDQIEPSTLPSVFRITPASADAYMTTADVAPGSGRPHNGKRHRTPASVRAPGRAS